MAEANSAVPIRVIEETPAYGGSYSLSALQHPGRDDLWSPPGFCFLRMDASQRLRVVVFESANPEFYLAHFDLTARPEHHDSRRAFGLPFLMDTFGASHKVLGGQYRKDRGCVRGGSSEFVLACDIAFRVAREYATRANPKRGGSASRRRWYRTPSHIWSAAAAALEIILGANDFDGDTAERYGYVNRALPTQSWTASSTRLARRIASFDRRAIAAAKNSRQPSLAAICRLAPRCHHLL